MAQFQSNKIVDPVKAAAFLRARNGPVLRRLIEDGKMVKDEARRTVGVHKPIPLERRTRKPGTLRDSIVTRIVEGGTQPTVIVGTDDPVGLYEQQGTPPHPIVARKAPLLVFPWPKVGGHIVAFKRVNHPGTPATHWLTGALRVLHGRYRSTG